MKHCDLDTLKTTLFVSAKLEQTLSNSCKHLAEGQRNYIICK